MDNLDWKHRLHSAVAEDCVHDLIDVLESQVTSHAGTASAKVKQTATREILSGYGADHDRLRVAEALCHNGSDTAAEVGAMVYAACYTEDPKRVADELHALADRPHWEVREWAASAAGAVLEKHFERFYPTVVTWTTDTSENVRRTALLALMYAGRSRNPDLAGPILDAIAPLLGDRSAYVAKNLGAFALGAALARYFPDEVVTHLHQWISNTDEQVRYNLAMVFTAAEGAKLAPRAKQVLDALRVDERPRVKRAVAKASKSVRARGPEKR